MGAVVEERKRKKNWINVPLCPKLHDFDLFDTIFEQTQKVKFSTQKTTTAKLTHKEEIIEVLTLHQKEYDP